MKITKVIVATALLAARWSRDRGAGASKKVPGTKRRLPRVRARPRRLNAIS